MHRYSAQGTYSPPEKGVKHMLYCRVAVGTCTKGRSSMITPPPRATGGIVPYDSVVDNPAAPSTFVVFRDAQAMPEYIVSFKER